MKQTSLPEYISTKKTTKKFICNRCKPPRTFTSARAFNIHISKTHIEDKPPPLYAEEGIKEIQRRGQYIDLRIRIKRTLWDSIKKVATSEKLKPEEAIIASLVNLTVYGATIETETKTKTEIKTTYIN